MPWKKADVESHKKGLTDKQQEAWVKIANRSLKSCIDAGGTDQTCAPRAIRTANKMTTRIKEGAYGPMAIENPELLLEAEELKREERHIMKSKIGSLIAKMTELEEQAKDGSVRKKLQESMDSLAGALKKVNGGADAETVEPIVSESALLVEELAAPEAQETLEEVFSVPEEAMPEKKGMMYARIIKPGWGASGYYSRERLQEDQGKYQANTHMYWNHQTAEERKARPERDLNHLAAVMTTDGVYEEAGPAGPGIYAWIKPFPEYRKLLKERAPYIGVSHVARGKQRLGEAEGRKGKIIEAIDQVVSVDFVTKAGAGGDIVAMVEAAKEGEIAESWGWDGPDGTLRTKRWSQEAAETWLKENGFKADKYERMAICHSYEQKKRNQLDGFHKDYSPLNYHAEDGICFVQGTYKKNDTVISEIQAVQFYHGETMDESQRAYTETDNEQEVKRMEMEEKVKELEKEKSTLMEEKKTLEADKEKAAADLKAFQEKELKSQVRGLVEAQVDASDLHDKAKARIKDTAVFEPVLTEAGALDEEKVKANIQEAIKAEKEYLAGLAESGAVKGLGAGKPRDDNEKGKEALKESYRRSYLAEGKSPEEADRLVKLIAEG